MQRISIITICRNNLEELISTCKSVEEQDLKPFEHFIVDGSDNENIKNWLIQNNNTSYRSFISEPDQGISDAFNKGIKNTRGDILVMLNSGDTLFDKTVLKLVSKTFMNNLETKWVHGMLNLLRGGVWVNIGKPFDKNKLYRGMRSTFHPTMYLRRELYERYGVYDLNLKIAMDYDMLCRIANEKFSFIKYPLAKFDPAGISSERYKEATKEAFQCYSKYFGTSIKQKVWLQRQLLLHLLITSKIGKTLYKLKVKLKMENL